MIWFIFGYMILLIYRPFEIWPWLAAIRLERVYALAMLCYLFMQGPISLRKSRIVWAVAALAAALLASAVLSPWSGYTRVQFEITEWLKIVVFFLVIVASVRTNRDLRLLYLGLGVAIGMYVGHSVWEYAHGRHSWRGSTTRIAGINETFNHAGSFATIALLGLTLVPLFWRNYLNPKIRIATLGYTVVASYAVLVLSGSRTGFAGLLFIIGTYILSSGRSVRYAVMACCLAPVVWSILPADKQDWLATTWSAEDGSAQNRTDDFYRGISLFWRYPLFGCGPGAWQQASDSDLVSHNLYGQVLGETGLAGILAFSMFIYAILRSGWTIYHSEFEHPDLPFVKNASATIVRATLLLLFLGLAGGTLYRFTWLFMAAFMAVTLWRYEEMEWESFYADDLQEDKNLRHHSSKDMQEIYI